jgi:hypothetical protein
MIRPFRSFNLLRQISALLPPSNHCHMITICKDHRPKNTLHPDHIPCRNSGDASIQYSYTTTQANFRFPNTAHYRGPRPISVIGRGRTSPALSNTYACMDVN